MNIRIHEPSNSLLVWADDPFSIRALIPRSKTLVNVPNYNVACQHTPESQKVLENLGYVMPAPPTVPALADYAWPGKHKPLAHQKQMVEFHIKNHRCFNLSEMGTMKTASCLWAADALMQRGKVRRALVLAPLSTLERVWQQEIFDVLMHRRAVIVHGTREKRLASLKLDVDFYILNHDGVKIREVFHALRSRADIDLVIVDEGGMFRNYSSDKYKALIRMLRGDQRVWWLTGTPVPNAPTDAWAQARVINPNGVPAFYGSFRRQTMVQLSTFKWLPRAGSERVAYAALQPAIRFKKGDCIDLPPVTTINLQAPLSAEQRDAFKVMKAHMTAQVSTERVTAINAADKIGKLRQILCGSVKVDDDYVGLPHSPRVKTLMEAIDSASAKVLVIVPFKGIIQALSKELSKSYTVGVLNGDVSINVRNKIIQDFKNTPDPHLLLCHPKVMAHGLNLTEADTLIFFAPIYSNDEFQQVIERFNRTGQTRKMTIVRIGAHPLEWAIYGMVDTKRVTQDNVLNLYKNILADAI